ncbi:MAG: M4 family metallopeptidase [Bdellovibrionia bacterium]
MSSAVEFPGLIQPDFEGVHSFLPLVFDDPKDHTLKESQIVQGPSKIRTVKYQHYYKGIRVFGSLLFKHSKKGKTRIRNKISQFDLSIRPQLSETQAADLARGFLSHLELKKTPSLQILPHSQENTARLVYWVELQSKTLGLEREIILDAHSGELLAELDQHLTIAPIEIFSAENQGIAILSNPSKPQDPEPHHNCQLLDLKTKKSVTINARACQAILNGGSRWTTGQCQVVAGDQGLPIALDPTFCTWVASDGEFLGDADPSAERALRNSKKVLNYFKDHFDRDSFDNFGSPLVSIVHAGHHMINAFWDRAKNHMVYGDGDGQEFDDFTHSIDVAGHEMTHGLTAHTANLVMMGESGALNEAFSDFFGKQIEEDDSWLIGKSLFKKSLWSPTRGIRDLKNPHSIVGLLRDPQGKAVNLKHPSRVSEAAFLNEPQPCSPKNDHCWVHFNSTIPGHASYLVTQALGKAKAELLYYTALTQNLSSTDNFSSAAQAILETCDDLQFSEHDCRHVREAYEKVEML